MPKRDPALVELSKSALSIREALEAGDVDREGFFQILRANLEGIQDGRQQSKVQHLLSDIVAIVFLAMLAGIDEWDEMEEFAREEEGYLKRFLSLPCGVPSHDTMQRVFSIIRPAELQETLVATVRDLVMRASADMDGILYGDREKGIAIKDIIAVDGKETRGSGKPEGKSREERCNLNQLNVQSTEYGITLSSTRISEKSNEIPEAQRGLRKLDLRGCVVTADALNAQKETARVIREESGGDYCLALKANRKCAFGEVADYFADKETRKSLKAGMKGDCRREVEENSRRTLIREYMVSEDIGWFEERKGWAALKSIGYEKKTTVSKKDGSKKVEERYFLTSLPADATLFAIAVRRHWHVENLLHWVLDVAFREDRQRTRDKVALENLSLVRRFVISILKILKSCYNLSYAKIRRKIGRRFDKEIPVIFATLKKMYDSGEV